MLSEVIWLLAAILLVFKTVTMYLRGSKEKQPPGPVPLPILGNILSLSNKPHLNLTEMAKTYGKVFQIYLGSKRVIVVNDGNLAKEILVKQGADFAGRPYVYSGTLYSNNGKSIGFADYTPVLKLQRKICQKAMNMLSKEEDVICREIEQMAKIIESMEGKPYDPHFHIGLVVVNVLCGNNFSTTYELEDNEFRQIIAMNSTFADTLTGNPADIFWWLKFIPTDKLRRLRQAVKYKDQLISRHFEEHKKTFDENNIRDLLDALIKAKKEVELEDSQTAKDLTDEHVKEAVMDTFVAGAEATTAALRWIILYLIRHPEVQTNVQEELDKVIGRDRLPRLSDRKNLNYLEAVINETLRISAQTPLGVPRMCTRDTNIGEYHVPKGTTVTLNMWAIHHDPSVWENPMKFDPTRFLDLNENIVTSSSTSGFLPFSLGRRSCLGENTARSIIFLFLAQILHRFRFDSLPGQHAPSDEHTPTLVLSPLPYQVNITRRE